MGRNNYFKFKKFTVVQEHSAMKVGIDSVLLGVWARIQEAQTILDVGTGTGLLALMMAQRSSAKITAVEIDESACREAFMNIDNSPWPTRIEVLHTTFQEFEQSTDQRFDCIVSNPPYFENSSKPEDLNRKNARHNDGLPFTGLIEGSMKLLNANGHLSVILPVKISEKFIGTAGYLGLFLNRTTWIKHNPEKPYHRRLLEFSRNKTAPEESILVIESQREYTEDYKNLTREFYLAF
jgi:tRNA1Val (adenine37-N6)-methyltransferase